MNTELGPNPNYDVNFLDFTYCDMKSKDLSVIRFFLMDLINLDTFVFTYLISLLKKSWPTFSWNFF